MWINQHSGRVLRGNLPRFLPDETFVPPDNMTSLPALRIDVKTNEMVYDGAFRRDSPPTLALAVKWDWYQ